jgi:predicted PurR-regulated permease PerM
MPKEYSFNKKALIAVSIGAFVIIVILMLFRLYNVFLLIFASILLSVFLRGLAHLLRKYINVKQSMALLIVIIFLIALSTGIGLLLGPNISENIDEMEEKIPEMLDQIEESLSEYSWGEGLMESIREAGDSPETRQRILGMFSSLMSVLIGIVVILVVGMYMAFHPHEYTEGFLKLIPKDKRKRGDEILHKLEHALVWWMIGRFASMIVIGVFTITGLLIIDVPLAFTLALMAALMTFIPNLGPVISYIPAVLIAYTDSPEKALYVSILYAGIQTLETYFITPIITKKAVSVSPALLISFEVIIGVLMGIPGLIVATPLLVAVIVVVQTMYVEDVLHDDVTVLGE